ncbi:MAG: Cellulose synthase 1 [Pseudomonadota bacterium]
MRRFSLESRVSNSASRPAWLASCLLAVVLCLLSLALWRGASPMLHPPDVPHTIQGMAYNAFQRWGGPFQQRFASDADIASDMQLLSRHTRRLRTYSSAELPRLPAIAADHGLRLHAGVWLDRRLDANERELTAVIEAVAAHSNIDRVIAGNETLLQDKLRPEQLHGYLARLRKALAVPVSTAEPWHVWLDQPELADHVDFITVHLLPYWEGMPVEAALQQAMHRLARLHERFPGKPIVIGEIGWPGGDFHFGAARATPVNQAQFTREFLDYAQRHALDYFIMEAVDQPWKARIEGRVGAHWGLFDARRNLKFELSGPIETDPYWKTKALMTSILAVLPLVPLAFLFPHMRSAGRLTFALSAFLVASFAVAVATQPLADYLSPLDLMLYSLLVPALLMMGAVFLSQMLEFAELFWPGSLRRIAPVLPGPKPLPPDPEPLALGQESLPEDLPAVQPSHDATLLRLGPDGSDLPWVSVHLACSNEPPEMVIATLRSLLALQWPHLQIVVIDNNTHDPALWQPVQDFVLATGDDRVKFHHLPHWPGFKAGALNYALSCTDPRAQWIGVVDADYTVEPDWLEQLAGYFNRPEVAAIQSPQAHRDWQDHAVSRFMNWEYEGFFRLGMHHRHERNALIQHGTMVLIRRESLARAGGWNPACVCEDAELGLRLLRLGQDLVYVDKVMGRGLVPSDLQSYLRQRRRWALGGMQILRLHARDLLAHGPLTLAQRYHFLAGWLPWMGDALHLCFSLLALAWTAGLLLAPAWFNVPASLFLAPIAIFAMVRLMLGPMLYVRRMDCSWPDVVGAALAGMSLSHRVARGVLSGLFGKEARFEITTKRLGPGHTSQSAPRQDVRRHPLAGVREEGLILLALMLAVAALLLQPGQPLQGALLAWTGVLMLQALPYAVTIGLTLFSIRRPSPSVLSEDTSQ